MKLIVGLGNPGEKYAKTRHNIGFMVVDRIVTSKKAKVTRDPDPKLATCYLLHKNIVLARPQTFMNQSGLAVKKLVAHFRVSLSDLWIIHDDLDICLRDYKIQKGKGPRVHNGLLSIYDALGTKNFWHVRVGVDSRAVEERTPGEKYVLQNFKGEELDMLDEVLGKIVGDLLSSLGP